MNGRIAPSKMTRLLALAALAMWVATAQAGGASASDDAALIRVESGSLRGSVTDGIASYKGIPYAAPPTGDRRWQAPAPPAPWQEVLSAGDYGASCEQAEPPGRAPFGSRAQTLSEDCLTLNVWAPVAHAAPLPVMVFIHGGGNVGGSGSDRYYDGSSFARDGVVLVTLNYRLGLFGFFAHPALAREAGAAPTANFGLLDQIAALRWVQANIGAFGGDPANVTVFGESAGGEDTVLLATSDAAKGLFARAIAESASDLWSSFPTMAQAETQGADIVTRFGLPGDRATAAQLRAIPVDQIAGFRNDRGSGPIADGRIMAGPASSAFEGTPHVPLMIGSNSGDGSLVEGVTNPSALFPNLSPAAFAAIRKSYGERGITENGAVAQQLFRDGFFAAPARWEAARARRAGQPAYLYRFDYIFSLFAGRRTAANHGAEIPFVFETFTPSLLSDADRAMEATMHGCWVAFARTGSPACPGASAWPRYDPHGGRRMVFDARSSVRDPDDAAPMNLLEKELGPR